MLITKKLGVGIALLFSLKLFAFSPVPFEESMQCSEGLIEGHQEWKLLKSLYQDYQNNFSLSDECLIPKLIHFIWLGSPLPEKSSKLVATWEQFHPDWTVKVWTDSDLSEFNLKNLEAFNRATNWGEKSDIWRYEILDRLGGVYVDTDFECLQPFDELHRSCEFYAGIQFFPDAVAIFNGIVGARAGHPIIKACVDNLRIGNGDHNASRIMEDTGPYLFTKMFMNLVSSCEPGKNLIFPTSFFYSFPSGSRYMTDRDEIKRQFTKPESLAVHYWYESWQVNKP